MKRKTTVRLLGAAIMGVAITPWLGGGPAAAVTPQDADIFVKQEQVPVTAAQFGNKATDCPGFAASEPFDYFHFVLDGAGYAFVELTAEFSTGDVTITSFGPPSAKHAYVKAPAGSTLENAYADITPDDAEQPTDFQLSHVCVGTPAPPPSSPPVTTTSAATTTPASVAATTAAAKPTTSVEAVKNAKPPAVLPKTGSGLSLGTTLAISLGLLLGGAALMFGSRRVAVAKGKRRRH
jgi:hypothetical protein